MLIFPLTVGHGNEDAEA